MNAHTFPVIPAGEVRQETAYPRFPRLTAAQKALQDAADAAFFRREIAKLDLKPGISVGTTSDRLSTDAWRCY